MEDVLVSYKVAKLAKEKGFDIPVNYEWVHNTAEPLDDEFFISYYENKHNFNEFKNLSAPTQSLLQKWLREKHKIHLSIVYSHDHNKYSFEGFDEFHANELRKRNPRSEGRFPYPYKSKFKQHYWNYNTYEEALEEGLFEALQLI